LAKAKQVISETEQYLLDVQSGKITACKRLRQLAEMMLPRFKDGYKRWHFDYEKAKRVCDFIEKFCVSPESGEPIVLEPFQKNMIQLTFGFVDDDGYRQFQEVMEVIARKCGKSSLGAALELYMLVADGEKAPQIYCAANSRAQASLAYGIALKMMRRSKSLNSALRKGTVPDRDQDGIIFDRNDGYITVLTSQTRNLDGLNVSFCLLDEMHANTNRDQYDLVKQAIGARKQPLLLEITTNGFERENLFDDQYDYGVGILDGKIEDDRFLPIIYELDDRSEWTDERCWIKSNPGIGTIKSWDYMRDAVNKGKQDPSFMPTLMTKDFNMPESRAAAWLTFDEAVNNEPMPELPESGKYSDLGFRYGIGGFDASDTTDLSAGKFLMMRKGDPHFYLLSQYWIPEEALRRGDGYRRERDDVPYRLWEERGLLRVVDGNTVPKRVFIEWLEEIKENFDVYTFCLGYDPWHILGTDEEQLVQYVGKSLCEKIRQGPQTLSMPGKEYRAQLANNLVVDGGSPINQWTRMNVQVSTDNNANIKFHKVSGKATNRIDGFMAELFAYIAYLRHKEEYEAII
jgi:phage terminase large subunit-like protein